MATLQDNNQQETANGNPINQPVIGGTSAASGQNGAGAAHSNSMPVSPVQQNAAPQNQQGYTDVSAYLNANPGGGQQIGQGVASNLTSGYNTAKSGIDTSVANANQSINSGYIPENTQLIQQVAANPTAAAADNSQLSAFQGQLNDAYSGPSNWADYGTQQGNVASAQQNASLLNTPGGNNALVQQVENTYNPGQNSQGINALDTLLFQGDPNAVATAQAAAQPYAGLTNYLNQANTGVTGNIAAGQQAATQTAQDALNAFTGANGTLTNLNNTVNQNTAAQLAAAQQQNQTVNQDLGNLYSTGNVYDQSQGLTNYNVGQLSPQDIAALGMTQDQWNSLQGALQNAGTSQYETGHNFGASSQAGKADILSYLQQQDPTQLVTNATTATPEQYAETAAINQLLGSQTPQGEALNPLNSAQAGTYNPSQLNQFNYGALTSDASNYATQAQKAAQDQANALTAQADLAHAQSQHGGGILGGIKQAVTHPGDLAGAIINPLSWGANLENISKGQTISPTNINPLKPTTSNQATQYVNNTPTQIAATAANASVLGAAHGGEIPDMDEYLNKVKKHG